MKQQILIDELQYDPVKNRMPQTRGITSKYFLKFIMRRLLPRESLSRVIGSK